MFWLGSAVLIVVRIVIRRSCSVTERTTRLEDSCQLQY